MVAQLVIASVLLFAGLAFLMLAIVRLWREAAMWRRETFKLRRKLFHLAQDHPDLIDLDDLDYGEVEKSKRKRDDAAGEDRRTGDDLRARGLGNWLAPRRLMKVELLPLKCWTQEVEYQAKRRTK